MKRILIASGIVLTFILIHFIFPNFYPSISNSIGELVKVDSSAKELYLENVKEKRNNKPKFEPVMSSQFKPTLTENVLYTENFASIWLSDKFQTAWSIKIDEIIVYKLQLPDDRVVRYIAQEFKTIRNLQAIRSKIKYETQESQIEQIKQLERESRDRFIKILDHSGNFLIIQKEQEKFFNQYIQKLN